MANNEGFTIIQNAWVRDKRITLKAKGLLDMIHSLPPDWDFSVRGLSAICKEGPDSIRAGLKELEEYGYLRRETSRGKDGTFRTSYTKIMEPVGKTPTDGENPDRWALSKPDYPSRKIQHK